MIDYLDYSSSHCLLLALTLLDSMDTLSEIAHYDADAHIEALMDSMHDDDRGYFECVLDLLHIRKSL